MEGVVVRDGRLGWRRGRGRRIIWVGDHVEVEAFGNRFQGEVVFQDGAFSVRIESVPDGCYQYDVGQVVPLCNFTHVRVCQ